MPTSIDPRTKEEIYESLKDNLTNRIAKLTNFAENTFNYVWTQAFANEQHEEEVRALAAQLSGWLNYAGRDLTQQDLNELGITGATPEEINEYMDDSQLDELGRLLGVSRDVGQRASGEVEITTNTSTTIPEGTEFGTEPNNDGSFLRFRTTDDISSDGAQTVLVGIQAVGVGDLYNVGANTITYMPNPPTGVDSVTNPTGTTGGEGIQDNDEFREDIQNAIVESSGGGTKDGVEAYIENNTNAISVSVQEQFDGDAEHGNYPHGDVIALGGLDSEVNEAIDESRPSAVEHILVRPDQFGVNVTATLEGDGVSVSAVEGAISNYFDSLLLGDDVVRDKIIQRIMNADPDIENIDTLEIEMDEEVRFYDSDSSSGDAPNHPYYTLSKGNQMEQQTGITEVTATVNGTTDVVLTEGSDYEEYDSDNLNYTSPGLDSINFDVTGDGSVDGENPDEDTEFFVTYRISEDVPIDISEVANSADINVSVA